MFNTTMSKSALAVLFALSSSSVSAMTAVQGSDLPQLFPADNWWNLDISTWPTDPNSAQYIAFINNGSTRHLHPDFGGNSGTGNGIYGIPYAVVSGATSANLLAVQFLYSDESDGVNHSTGQSFAFYPIPPEAITQSHWIEGGDPGNIDERSSSDRHLLIVDKDRNYLYELYNVFYDGTSWQAGSGAFFDMNTNNRRPDSWTSADAAGLAILPGLVRYNEVYGAQFSDIKHAFRVTVRATNGYVYPASHRAGSNSSALPMGARLRLKSSVDVTQRTSDPYAQKIFRAMQKYGLIVADNGSDMFITGTYDVRWNNDVLNPAFSALTASDFEVAQLGYNPTFILTVSSTGTGSGKVTSVPTGINCTPTCSASFVGGANITLTTTPNSGSTFGGWSGDADCADGLVTMSTNKVCTATFIATTPPTGAVVSTNPPTALTSTSVTLNGAVTSSGAMATVSFDFGTTTSYGTNIPAGTVYSSTPIAVTANRTGLTCNTVYHYRVKAINSSGTTLGTDRSFTTLGCPTDIAITLSDGRSSVSPGSILTYLAIVSNAGPTAANNTVLKAPAVANLTVTSITCGTPTGGAVCPTSPTVTNLQGTGVVIPTLPAHGGLTFTINTTVVATAPNGALTTYTAILTAPSGVVDTNITNNTATDVDRVLSRPDLVVTSVITPATSPTANGTFSAVVTVKNQGTAATGRFYVDVWANQTATPGCGSTGDAWANINALAAGTSVTLTFNGLPAGAVGAKTLRAFVDSWCDVVESNESNNQLTKSYTVQ